MIELSRGHDTAQFLKAVAEQEQSERVLQSYLHSFHRELFEEARSGAAQIPGHLAPHDVVFLVYFPLLAAKETGGGNLMEIGVFAGKSAFVLAATAKRLNCRVLCIDCWEQRDPLPKESLTPKQYFFRHVRTDRHTVLEGRSESVLPSIPDNSLSFLFVDGGHDEDSCRADCRHVDRLLKPGGIVLFHDYCPIAWPGVVRAVDAFRDTHRHFTPLMKARKRCILQKGKPERSTDRADLDSPPASQLRPHSAKDEAP